MSLDCPDATFRSMLFGYHLLQEFWQLSIRMDQEEFYCGNNLFSLQNFPVCITDRAGPHTGWGVNAFRKLIPFGSVIIQVGSQT